MANCTLHDDTVACLIKKLLVLASPPPTFRIHETQHTVEHNSELDC